MWIGVTTVLALLLSSYLGYGNSTFNPSKVEDETTNENPFGERETKAFCRGFACPRYTVTLKRKGYEVRCYDAMKWVITEGPVAGSTFARSTQRLNNRLFYYFDGDNFREAKIDTTMPLRIERPLKGKNIRGGQMRMSLWLPPKFQITPPIPYNPEVHISEEGKRCFYVLEFDGYVLFKFQYMRRLKILAELLRKDNLEHTYDASMFMFVGYDPLKRIFGRHNEIWLEKKL